MINSDLYFKKTYTKKAKEDFSEYSDESSVLLDVECHSRHQNINPGTVTVEGFGMECWGYEDSFGKLQENLTLVSYADLPVISTR